MSPTRSRNSSAPMPTDVDFLLCEIGGTVGDIESLPFLEAIRQLGNELGPERTLFVHLTLVPWIPVGRRAEDQADPAFGQGAAERRHPARHPALPLRPRDPARGAAQDRAVLQRAARGGDPGARCRHHLSGAGGLSRRGLRYRGLPPFRPRRRRSPISPLASGGGAHPPAGRRGRHRRRRQIHEPARFLQVAGRGAGPWRHRQQCEGRAQLDRFRDLRARGHGRSIWKACTASWCRAASASAAPRARSRRRASRASARCPISASASACRWR